jgi:hypothetical protein
MAEAQRASTACDQCGQTDDHPKHHFGVETFHHDCVPARLVRQIEAAADSDDEDVAEQAGRALDIRKVAQGGTRGAKLLAHIEKLDEKG